MITYRIDQDMATSTESFELGAPLKNILNLLSLAVHIWIIWNEQRVGLNGSLTLTVNISCGLFWWESHPKAACITWRRRLFLISDKNVKADSKQKQLSVRVKRELKDPLRHYSFGLKPKSSKKAGNRKWIGIDVWAKIFAFDDIEEGWSQC